MLPCRVGRGPSSPPPRWAAIEAPHSASMYLSMAESGAHVGRMFKAGLLSGIIDVTDPLHVAPPTCRFCRPAAVSLRREAPPNRTTLATRKPPQGGPNLF